MAVPHEATKPTIAIDASNYCYVNDNTTTINVSATSVGAPHVVTPYEFSIDGTGASVTRNIRRDYDYEFEIVDSSGVTITAQPASSCTAGTDNALTFTAPVGKTLTYAITPVYEN